jgi:DNA-binding CsgD family transcriptional regulator
LHDELVRRFFEDDERAHLQLGRESASWALRDGPCKTFLDGKNFVSFVGSLSKLWTLYFADTTSWCEASVSGDSVELSAFDLPEWHAYLEHFVVGYMTEMMEMVCANPMRATRIHGGNRTRYQYLLHQAPFSDASAVRVDAEIRPPSDSRAPHLSDREMKVLLLVAEGKTNPEIGIILGISAKTAQHHVASVYRKVGVPNRVGATRWLAERGLVGR